MKKLFLIFIWLICLANGFFFADILINFFLGYTESAISGATTKESQAYFSVVMLVLITLTLYLYTKCLTFKKFNSRNELW
jgi:hypothetical protein